MPLSTLVCFLLFYLSFKSEVWTLDLSITKHVFYHCATATVFPCFMDNCQSGKLQLLSKFQVTAASKSGGWRRPRSRGSTLRRTSTCRTWPTRNRKSGTISGTRRRGRSTTRWWDHQSWHLWLYSRFMSLCRPKHFPATLVWWWRPELTWKGCRQSETALPYARL